MKLMYFDLFVFILSGIVVRSFSETVVFPSGVSFTAVNDSLIDDADLYADVKFTGSVLIDTVETANTLSKRLGKNVPVSQFKYPGARYLRAHPTFIRCLQQVIMKLKQNQVQVEILRGFITSNESSGSDVDNYLQSGCGAQLRISGTTGSLEDIASTVLQVCPVILEREMRDLYVELMTDRVHFHMSGPEETGFQFVVSGVAGITDPEQWAEDEINKGLEPSGDEDCSNYNPLSNGNHYPERFSHHRVLGDIDGKVSRNMTEFKRLVQYQGTNIEFENNEGSSAWCGEEDITCPSACADRLLGNTVNQRCADRVMSTRLMSVMKKLQKKARTSLNDKLKVLEAWDEPYEGNPDGDSADDTLHYEGRAVKVTLSSGDTSKLAELSQFAICLGADYVEHRGDYLYIAAKRHLSGGSKVNFPNMELLEVEVPVNVESAYNLPSSYTESEKRQYPLFDSSGRLNASLSPGVTLGQFVSKNYRYFRLSPRIHDCYVDVVYQENKRRNNTDPKIEIEVVTGYLSNIENSRRFDVINDNRYNRHPLGVAMQIRYKPSPDLPATCTPYKLLKTVIDKCAPRFYQTKQEMGIGLYPDSVFVDVRSQFHLMNASSQNLPEGVDHVTFAAEITQRYILARGGKIVNPENVTIACLYQTRPHPQSYSFQHEHSEIVKRKRRRRRSTDEASCVPTRNTQFCSSSEQQRKKVMNQIFTLMPERKHYPGRTRDEIVTAFEGCFGDCGTCLEGEIMESKTEHCNNFLHWVDFPLLNDAQDVSNIFVRSDLDETTRFYACENGHDCVENSPLFSLIAPIAENVFRPDETKSVDSELYPVASNPLPVMSLLEDIYTIQASGVVKFWVKDDTEMTALKRQLEVVMLYNRNVTLIKIYVTRYDVARDAVRSVVEKAARSMANNGCPDESREALTEYVILKVPTEKKKRAAEQTSVRYKVRDYHKNFERRWTQQHALL